MVIDTSVIIQFLRAKDKKQTELFALSSQSPLYVSVVTVFELFIGATTAAKKKDAEIILNGLTVLPFTVECAEKASAIYLELHRKNKLIEFRDIFIAASAMVNNQPVKTLNVSHFSRVPGLKLL
jgi:tRNA(fMet)-specific endonuclease VapC